MYSSIEKSLFTVIIITTYISKWILVNFLGAICVGEGKGGLMWGRRGFQCKAIVIHQKTGKKRVVYFIVVLGGLGKVQEKNSVSVMSLRACALAFKAPTCLLTLAFNMAFSVQSPPLGLPPILPPFLWQAPSPTSPLKQ